MNEEEADLCVDRGCSSEHAEQGKQECARCTCTSITGQEGRPLVPALGGVCGLSPGRCAAAAAAAVASGTGDRWQAGMGGTVVALYCEF